MIPDFVQKVINEGLCREEVAEVSDMNSKELAAYNHAQQTHKAEYKKTWKQVLTKWSRFKKPQLINEHLIQPEDDLWVFPCLVKPGKQQYIVRKDPPNV